ncbi:MAG: ABC transporter ATP-binding protein [Burkholderiales bacterium]
MAAVLAARGVAKTYSDGTAALAPVDVTVDAGEFVTLLGPSGCGKTTLLRLLAGLMAPSAGTLAWWSSPSLPHDDAARRLAMVFQSPTLMPWASVLANVRLPLDLDRAPRAAADAQAQAALSGVGLAGAAHKFPRELSGGMQMRASLARALVMAPALLLMDEPFGALDEFTRHRLDVDLAALCHARGLTVVFVTHSIQEAVFLASRVLVMAPAPGRVVAEVTIDAPRPRPPEFRGAPEFAAYCARLSAAIAQASLATELS